MFQWKKTLAIINELPKPGELGWIENTYATIYRAEAMSIPSWLEGRICAKMRAWFKDANHVITCFEIVNRDDVLKALHWNWQIEYLARVFDSCMPFMRKDGMFLYFRDSAAQALQHKISEAYHGSKDSTFKLFIMQEYTERFWQLPADDEAQMWAVHNDGLYHDSIEHLNIQEIVNFAWLTKDNSLEHVSIFRVADYLVKSRATIQMWNWWLEKIRYWEFGLMSSAYQVCRLDRYWQGFEIRQPIMGNDGKAVLMHELLDNFYYFRENLSPMAYGKFEKMLKIMVDASRIPDCTDRFNAMFNLKKEKAILTEDVYSSQEVVL